MVTVNQVVENTKHYGDGGEFLLYGALFAILILGVILIVKARKDKD